MEGERDFVVKSVNCESLNYCVYNQSIQSRSNEMAMIVTVNFKWIYSPSLHREACHRPIARSKLLSS